MKEHNEIDHLFEEALGNLKVEPDVASWNQLLASLDTAAVAGNSGRKRRFFIFAIIGSVAALLSYLFLFNKDQNRYIDKKDIRQVEVKKSGLEQKTVHVQSIEPKSESQNSSYSSAISKTSKASIKSNNITTSNNKSDSEVRPIANNVQRTSNNRKTVKQKSQQEQKVAVSMTSSALIEPSVDKSVSVQNAVYQTEVKSIAETSADKSSAKASNLKVKEEVAVEGAKTSEEAKLDPKAIAESTTNIEEQKEAEASAPSPSGITGVHNATALSLGVYGGSAFINSNEDFVLNEGQLVYQTEKEQRIITPTIGLDINYHINNWFVRSGVAYAEYGENRTYLNKIEMHDTVGFSRTSVNTYYTYDTTGWINNPEGSGGLIPVYDAVLHYDTMYSWVSRDSMYYENQKVFAQNRFRYIEIPLMLGYELRYKNLGIALATGISVGFKVNSSGMFMDSNKQLVNINALNSPYTNTMMNYIFTVGVNYHLSSRLSITARPVYKTNLNSIVKSGVGSDIRYNSFGLNLGINYIID